LLDYCFDDNFNLSDIDFNFSGFWRYRKMLPVSTKTIPVSYNECFTPFEKAIIDGKEYFIKHDYLFPSGSYKDRGSSIMLTVIKENGVFDIVEDSSGNAGASVAAYSAKAGIHCQVLVPSSTSLEKTLQIERYGADLVRIAGNREQTTNEAKKLALHTYYASHIFNPLFFQGIKTLAYELCEQCNWQQPDHIITPVGNGTLVIGLFLGFSELLSAGIIKKMPGIVGIQAENCSPLYQHFKNKSNDSKTKETIAEGIAITNPPRFSQIISCINNSNGFLEVVSEDDIIKSNKMAALNGYYIEPTSSVVFAALDKPSIKSLTGKTVLILTGNGLKSYHK